MKENDMKKKLSLFSLIILIFVVFVGCLPVNTEENQTTETMVDATFKQIIEGFPDQIDKDYTFPTLDDGLGTVSYYVHGTLLADHTYEYVSQNYDETIPVIIVLSYLGQRYERVATFIQLKDKNAIDDEQKTIVFDRVFEEVESGLPEIVNSDIALPTIDDEEIELTYEAYDLEIYRNRLLYDFHDFGRYTAIRIQVTYASEVRTKDAVFYLAGIDELPKIPELHIQTIGNTDIDSKETYRQATMDLKTNGLYEGIQEDFSNVPLKIRLRGNSTFSMPKKSYKIKFNDKREMFTDYKEKDWVLLANYADQSLIRNYLANQLAEGLDMPFVPISVFVDVYINGEYMGNYMLTDQVEVTNDRVNVEEGSSELNTGYLLEWDNRLYDDTIDHSGTNYFFIRGIPFVIKSPNWEDPEYSINQLYYIEDYMLTVYLTLQNQEDYSEIIDEKSFIDWYIVNEVFQNVDAGFSSIYLYKEKDGILKMGPVWDFDLALGNAGHLDASLRQPEGFYVSREEKNKLYYFLMQYPSFRTQLKARWNEVYEADILPLLDKVHPITEQMTLSVYQNFNKWDVLGTNDEWYTTPEVKAADTYVLQVWLVYDFLEERIAWLNEAINNLS